MSDRRLILMIGVVMVVMMAGLYAKLDVDAAVIRAQIRMLEQQVTP